MRKCFKRTPRIIKRADTRPLPSTDPDITFRVAKDRFQSQQKQVEALDGKIGNLLGFSGVLIAIMSGFLALNKATITPTQIILLYVSGAAFIAIVVISLVAYYTKPWESGPALDEIWENARHYTARTMGWWAAESFTRSYENNISRISCKIHAVNLNITLLVTQAITLAIGLALIAVA